MIELYTATTPNGQKVSILLEELGLDYQVKPISLLDQEQKTPEFLAINPNGRIPAIIDHDEGDLPLFESGAILIHLAEKTGSPLLPSEPQARARVMQWLMFQMSAVGPMQGQANVFNRYTEEKIPFAIDRYMRECRRLYEVMNRQLAQQPYLADDYSIADIATYPWVAIHEWTGLDMTGLDHLQEWLKRCSARPAVERGMAVPQKVEMSSNNAEAIYEKARTMLV